MPDDSEALFDESLDINESMASVFSELLTDAPLTLAGGVGAAVIAIKVFSLMLSSGQDEKALAIHDIQQELRRLRLLLDQLHDRVEQLTQETARQANRATLRALQDLVEEVHQVALELVPQLEVHELINLANRAGMLVDRFIRDDFDLWRWFDVLRKPDGSVVPRPNMVKNLPTLPGYLTGLLTWLAVREQVVEAGERARLDDDAARVKRHFEAVSLRPTFDKYGIGESPLSIAEHLKWNIRTLTMSLNRVPDNDECRYRFQLRNLMSGSRSLEESFFLVASPGSDLCPVNLRSIGAPDSELRAEDEVGAAVLALMAQKLERVMHTGSLREQFIGVFPTEPIRPPATFYIVDINGKLQWYKNFEAAKPGGSTAWEGPIEVGEGWNGQRAVFNGGGRAMYNIEHSGRLVWRGHEGHLSGSAIWRGETLLANDWNAYETVFPGGESIIYGARPNGDLVWNRHDGAVTGRNAWAPPQEAGSGWTGFRKIFSGGKGVIYTIGADGTLMRHVHTGYLVGTMDWERSTVIGRDFHRFVDVIAAADGVLYAFTHDGRILRYWYGDHPFPVGGGIHPGTGQPGIIFDSHVFLEGPVEIRRGLGAMSFAVSVMESAEPFVGPN